MTTERTVAPAAGAALAAACAALREGGEPDAIAGVRPAFVASPASTDEASALLRAAAGHGLTVVPRGAGTGLGWATPPASCDLAVDMSLMDRVLEHAAGDLVARIQAGASIGKVASVLATAGQQLALDVPADATVGGVVATGTAGPRRFRYGAPRDLLIGITVVRADGVIARSGGKVVKNVAGYDLGKLFSGSQGTLGLITEVTFRLHPLPASVAWVTGEFGPSDLAGVTSAVTWAAGSALVPSAVELDWTGGPRSPAGPRVLRAGVLLEGSRAGVPERARQMAELLASAGARPTTAVSEVLFRWWQTVPEAGAPGTVVRISYWVRDLGEVLDALAAAGAGAGVPPSVGGPAGAGLLYARLDPGTEPDAAVRFVRGLRDRLSGGSGRDGHPRGSVVVLAATPPVMAAAGAYGPVPGAALMRAIKDQFDPDHRMSPGRLTGGS
jgi:glycolate oxidase FAD binding subunit